MKRARTRNGRPMERARTRAGEKHASRISAAVRPWSKSGASPVGKRPDRTTKAGPATRRRASPGWPRNGRLNWRPTQGRNWRPTQGRNGPRNWRLNGPSCRPADLTRSRSALGRLRSPPAAKRVCAERQLPVRRATSRIPAWRGSSHNPGCRRNSGAAPPRVSRTGSAGSRSAPASTASRATYPSTPAACS